MPKPPKRILYIEDNYENKLLVRRILESEGFEVIEAEDGLSGIETARRENPDLILMDINIPGIDGYEAATKIKGVSEHADTPIIAITASALHGDKERSIAAGCDGFIQKPINVERFPEQIREFIGGKRETLNSSEESRYLREYSRKLVDRLEEKIRDLTRANEELKELDKMKDEFLQNLSHELRTPLTPIKGYIEMLKSRELGNLNQIQFETLDAMEKSVSRLSNMIEGLLELAGLETRDLRFPMQEVSLADILDEVAKNSEAMVSRKGVAFGSNIPPVGGLIVGNREKLLKAFSNLMENAAKFTPRGGRVELCLERVDAPSVLENIGDPDRDEIPRGDYYQVDISDTGIGIPSEFHKKVFERFYQVDGSLTRKFEGVGLGLAVARKIIENHYGRIVLKSVPGKGSVFSVILPVVD